MSGLVLALALAVLMVTVPQLLHQAEIVEYRDGVWRAADKAEICPGETFSFPITISVNEGPAFMRIVESWCRVSDNICPRQFSTAYELALLEPVDVDAMATRRAPDGLTPGEWELHHINESHVSGKITVNGYGVRMRVKAVDECGNE